MCRFNFDVDIEGCEDVKKKKKKEQDWQISENLALTS